MYALFVISSICYMSSLVFDMFCKNKYYVCLPVLSALWIGVFKLIEHMADNGNSPVCKSILDTVSDIVLPHVLPLGGINLIIFYHSLIVVPIYFLWKAIMILRKLSKEKTEYTDNNFLKIVILSIVPLFVLGSYGFCFAGNGLSFLGISIIIWIPISIVEKHFLIKYNYALSQTIIKTVILLALIEKYGYDKIGHLLVVITDCMICYILAQAKKNPNFPENLCL